MDDLEETPAPDRPPVPQSETRSSGIVFSRKDIILLILSFAPSLAGLNSDPLIVVPMLVLSVVSFIYLCVTHPGRVILRAASGIAFTLLIGFVGIRALAWQGLVSRLDCNIDFREDVHMSSRGYGTLPTITRKRQLLRITSQTL